MDQLASARLTCFVPARALRFGRDLFLGPALDLAPGVLRAYPAYPAYPAALVPAVHDLQALAGAAAVPERPEFAVAQGPGLIYEPLRLFVAAAANAERRECSAGVTVARLVDYPAATAGF